MNPDIASTDFSVLGSHLDVWGFTPGQLDLYRNTDPEPTRVSLPLDLPAPVSVADRAWVARRACGPGDLDLFYGDPHTHLGEQRLRAAEDLCRSCPVRIDCLRDAVGRHETEAVCGAARPDVLRRLAHDLDLTPDGQVWICGCDRPYVAAVEGRCAVCDRREEGPDLFDLQRLARFGLCERDLYLRQGREAGI